MATRSGRVMGAVLGLAVAGAAHAADVGAGAQVQIKKIARADAFFSNRKSLVGLVCVTTDEGLHEQGRGRWVGGEVVCVDGGTYYFYKVEVVEGDFGIDPAVLLRMAGRTVPGEAPSYPPAVEGDGQWTPGESFAVTSVSPEDAYYQSGLDLVGLVCTADRYGLEDKGDGYWGGGARCNGEEYYFFKVGVGPAGPSEREPAAGFVGVSVGYVEWPAGRMVKLVDIAPADALAPQKASLVGRACAVLETALVPTVDGYHAGRLFCDDGKTYQVFQVKVAAP